MKKSTYISSEKVLGDKNNDINENSTFQIIFEQSPISTQIFSPGGTLLKVNKAWVKLWGAKFEDVKGYNILKDKQLIDLKIMPLIKRAFNGEVLDLPPVKYEPNKTINDVSKIQFRWTKALIYPIKDSKERIQKVVLVHEDITEQKLNEQKLIESEERFRALIEKSTDAVQLVSPTGEILFTSESIKNVLGYTPEELKGLGVAPFMHPDDLEYFSSKIQELLKNPKKHIIMQYRVKHKDGSWAWLETTGVNHLNTPYINALVGNFRNITDRKKNEEDLRYQKSLLEAQRELSPEGVLVVSPDGKMVSYNKRFVKMWKFSEKLINIGEDQLALEDATKKLIDPEKFIKRVKQLYKEQKADFEELHFKGGRIFDRYGAPVVGEDGTNYGYVWFFQDVTKRKQLERQKDDFISIASHELKTPVTSIKSYAQVLELKFKKEGNEKAAELLSKMDAQVSKLTNLIGDLLDVTKMDTNSIHFNNTQFSFDELVEELVEEMQRTTEKHELILKGKTNKTINGDRDRIGQVLTNLISNAIKYSPHTRKIIIQSSIKKSAIYFSVEDFGVGIPKNEQDKIFERFFRTSGPGKETFPGLGLGLYISREIIKMQGGKLWVESKIGQGSKFCFTLPIKQNRNETLKNISAGEELKQG
ncbi:MAG TPA: PAS domain-containing sensor histidine kinase [Candidatus Limnocylindrales bacterium]|nr:PAS domain-containing sensor histidine kinase [Candidatus Limnocylindrales bacterium]